MTNVTSRREFLLATGGACALARGVSASPVDSSRAGIEAEIRRRAEDYQSQRYLVVDYYRIRRKLAYPLPVESLSIPSVPVPSISDYPWPIWMLWELEERVNSLGWAAEWFKNKEFAQTASRDIEALTGWPRYRQYRQPDLSSGHAGRLLWIGFTKWPWVSGPLREKVRAACRRHVDEVLPESDRHFGQIRSKQDLLALPSPYGKLHNIPLIGTVGAALTASVANHPAASHLNQLVRAIFGAILDLRAKGFTEGVGYDGYVLDFIADWLEVLPAGERQEILAHPNLKQYLEESYMLAAPGAMERVAELSDVEPKEMPFHFSAQAKLEHFQRDSTRAWFLRRWKLDWVRSDALGALHPLVDRLRGEAPEPGALNAHYAAVLRTGWEDKDLAVAISCTNSPMGHLQSDNGTLVIGTRGQWIISDPGYQQYMRGIEREFTLGPAAHNYPVINGIQQDKKQPRLLLLNRVEPGVFQAKLELAACYPAEAKVRSLVRNTWLNSQSCVIVADLIEADGVQKLTYHWHGNPEAAWWSRDGWILIHMRDANLWLTSPQARLSDANIQRLPGSRGQLTVVADADPASLVIWWAFAIMDTPPRVEPVAGGRGIQILGKRFEV